VPGVSANRATGIFFAQHIDEETGTFAPGKVQEDAATLMLDELLRWAEALRPLRRGG
jgi:hypothetical protein